MSTTLCILGPSGRMGQELIAAAQERADVKVVSAVDHPDSALVGTQVGEVTVSSDLEQGLALADVYIDFTTPAATERAARTALTTNTAAIVGTTGLLGPAIAALGDLAKKSPVLTASNFSLGVNLLFNLAEQAARALGDEFDLEVLELHHRRKRDAPSGTALSLGQAMASGRDFDFAKTAVPSRHGEVGARKDEEIGLMSIRGGDIAGEHTAFFIGADERLEITHRAGNRSIFATGALAAASYIANKPAGRYAMSDVLGLATPAHSGSTL